MIAKQSESRPLSSSTRSSLRAASGFSWLFATSSNFETMIGRTVMADGVLLLRTNLALRREHRVRRAQTAKTADGPSFDTPEGPLPADPGRGSERRREPADAGFSGPDSQVLDQRPGRDAAARGPGRMPPIRL